MRTGVCAAAAIGLLAALASTPAAAQQPLPQSTATIEVTSQVTPDCAFLLEKHPFLVRVKWGFRSVMTLRYNCNGTYDNVRIQFSATNQALVNEADRINYFYDLRWVSDDGWYTKVWINHCYHLSLCTGDVNGTMSIRPPGGYFRFDIVTYPPLGKPVKAGAWTETFTLTIG